jgi:hypothetical protein
MRLALEVQPPAIVIITMNKIIVLVVAALGFVACGSDAPDQCPLNPESLYAIAYSDNASNPEVSLVGEFFPHDCSPEQVSYECTANATVWHCDREDDLSWVAEWQMGSGDLESGLNVNVKLTDPVGHVEVQSLVVKTSK